MSGENSNLFFMKIFFCENLVWYKHVFNNWTTDTKAMLNPFDDIYILSFEDIENQL